MKEFPKVEAVQLKFVKYLLGVKIQTTIAVLGEVGEFPVIVSHHITLLKYWCRLSQLDDEKLVKRGFSYSSVNSTIVASLLGSQRC